MMLKKDTPPRLWDVTLPFDKERTYSLRGIAMLMIIVSHIYQHCVNESTSVYLSILWTFGYIGTGIFFLLSGYGLFCSLKRSEIVHFSHGVKRIIKLIKPFLFAFVCVVLFYCFYDRTRLNESLLVDLVSLTVPNSTTWFFKVIIALYLFVFAIFSIIKRKSLLNILIITALCLIYVLVTIHLLPGYWWDTVMCFPLGMLAAYYRNDMIRITQKAHLWHEAVFMIISFILFVIAEPMMGFHNYGDIGRIFSSILIAIMAIEIIRYVNPCCKILNYVGKYSLNFYLFQIVALNTVDKFTNIWWLYAFGAMFLTFALSFVFNKIDSLFRYNI